MPTGSIPADPSSTILGPKSASSLTDLNKQSKQEPPQDPEWIVLKFDGGCVGSAEKMKKAVRVVREAMKAPGDDGSPPRKVAIVMESLKFPSSPCTTDRLLECTHLVLNNSQGVPRPYACPLRNLERDHLQLIRRVLQSSEMLHAVGETLERQVLALFGRVREILEATSVIREISPRLKDSLVSTGDIVSAKIMTSVLQANGIPAVHIETCSLANPNYDDDEPPDVRFFTYIMHKISNILQKSTSPPPPSTTFPTPPASPHSLHSPSSSTPNTYPYRVAVIPGAFGPFPREHPMLTSLGNPHSYPTILSTLIASALPNCVELRLLSAHIRGIYTGDPRIVKGPRRLKVLEDWEAEELSMLEESVVGLLGVEVLKLGKGWAETKESGKGLRVRVVRLEDEVEELEEVGEGRRGTVIVPRGLREKDVAPISPLSVTNGNGHIPTLKEDLTPATAVIYCTGFSILQIRPFSTSTSTTSVTPSCGQLYVRVLKCLEKSKIRVGASCVVGGRVVVALEDPVDRDGLKFGYENGDGPSTLEKTDEPLFSSSNWVVTNRTSHPADANFPTLTDLKDSEEDLTNSGCWDPSRASSLVPPPATSTSRTHSHAQLIHPRLRRALDTLQMYCAWTFHPNKSLVTLIGPSSASSTSKLVSMVESLGVRLELLGAKGVKGGGLSFVVGTERVEEVVRVVHEGFFGRSDSTAN
ncbi:Aspartokinase [Chytridiales sp. JEL 0842]|nr:Aspartokinase [Chytridiales sp. JEL 0842]